LDSIADIAGVAMALDLIGAGRITSRSVPPGSGAVKCAHGLMPVPAPGTAGRLKGVPLAASPVKAEPAPPTGAAVLTKAGQEGVAGVGTAVVREGSKKPLRIIEQMAHGAGRREFMEQPNLLRVFVGTVAQAAPAGETDQVWVLETNLDDLPAEVIGYCFERLL